MHGTCSGHAPRGLLLGSVWPSLPVACVPHARAVGLPWAALASRVAYAVSTAYVATARATWAGLACAHLVSARLACPCFIAWAGLTRPCFTDWAGLASPRLACGFTAWESISCTIARLSR